MLPLPFFHQIFNGREQLPHSLQTPIGHIIAIAPSTRKSTMLYPHFVIDIGLYVDMMNNEHDQHYVCKDLGRLGTKTVMK